MKRIFLFTIAAFIVPVILLSGCLPSVPFRQELAQKVSALEQEISRVYFFNGYYYSTWKMDLNKYGCAGNIYIQDDEVGRINEKEYIVIDISPGNYEMFWQPIMSDFDLSKHKSQKITKELKPNKIYYLSANTRDSDSKAAWFGLVGIMAANTVWIDTLDEETLNPTSVRLVDYKVLDQSDI